MADNVTPFRQGERNLAVMYGRIRDAVRINDCSPAERIAILEMVKAELVRECQQLIDDGA